MKLADFGLAIEVEGEQQAWFGEWGRGAGVSGASLTWTHGALEAVCPSGGGSETAV